MKLDPTDTRLLDELQRDGRRSIVDLAERTGLSHTPCARRVRQMEQGGVIEGYAAVLNPRAIGLQVMAYVQVKLERHVEENVASFARALADLEPVVSCQATTGEYDFMLLVMATDLDALSNVVLKGLLAIPGVRDVHSSIVLQTIKRSARLPLGHLGRGRD
ncbi:MAG: Lrp/AsnC family transcriptional regulator [Gammaproteobacteria bacterium]|nr:Lrp/AsnC family transcriptional regulator [Gammaproteobacteria bacterium]